MHRCLSLLFCLLLAAACQHSYYCGLDPSSTPARPVFDFGTSANLAGTAKVNAVTISGTPPPDACAPDWHLFWSIATSGSEPYRELDKLEYGALPAGFQVIVPAETLLAEYIYEVHIGYHGIGTDCYFEISADSLGVRTIRPLTEAEYRAIVFSPGG